jgi:hypothetical protein
MNAGAAAVREPGFHDLEIRRIVWAMVVFRVE